MAPSGSWFNWHSVRTVWRIYFTGGDIGAFNRYRRKIDIGVGLEHPGIQRLLSDASVPYMVLENVDGQLDPMRRNVQADRLLRVVTEPTCRRPHN